MPRLASKLLEALRAYDLETVKLFMEHNFPLDYRLTVDEFQLYSLLMCRKVESLDQALETPYFHCLVAVARKKPDLLAQDKFGRTCLHHACTAGNRLGAEFTMGLAGKL